MNDACEQGLQVKLGQETARISWVELQRFFAQGHVVWVEGELDLVEVARWVACDEAARMAVEMERGTIAPATDEQARRWFGAQAELWAVVVKPWVLVQEDGCGSGSTPTPAHG